jgi:outer membrane protein TolC
MCIARKPARYSRLGAAARTTLKIPLPGALTLLLALSLPATPSRADLGIDETVRLALADDPVIAARQARSQAYSDNAVADGQLPDPTLKTGLYNLPLDDFELDEEPTTQLRLGLVQSFPRGRTRHFRRERGEWLAASEAAAAESAALQLVRDVRNSFLELYYQVLAERIVTNARELFAQLVDITRSHYASGRVSQQDVLRSSLELSRLDDRTTRIRNEADRNRAALMKWIGDAALLPVSTTFPKLPPLPAKPVIDAALTEHPVVRQEMSKLEAENRAVQIAREQYKPGWSAGLEYRKRFGDDPDGSDRADMMAAMVSLDLPLFPKNRQDRRLSASLQQAGAIQLSLDDRVRELQRMLESDYASWQRLGERLQLYESQLQQEAAANAQASLKAYQSGVTEFSTLMRARITDLDVQLEALRIRVDRAKAQSSLLYLAGDKP